MFSQTELVCLPSPQRAGSIAATEARDHVRIVLVGGGELFVKALHGWKRNAETEIVHFVSALNAFQYFLGGTECDVLIFSLPADDQSGLALMMQLRRSITCIPLMVFADPKARVLAPRNCTAPSHETIFLEQSRGRGSIVESHGPVPIHGGCAPARRFSRNSKALRRDLAANETTW